MFAATLLFASLAVSALAFENRNGAAGEVRVFNFLDTNVESQGALPAVLAADPTIAYNSAAVKVDTVFGADRVTIFGSVPGPLSTFVATTDDFTLVDLEGQNRQVEITLTGVAAPANTVCSVNIQPNARNTIIIRQSVNGEFVPAPTCSAQGQTCNVIDQTQRVAGQVSFSCDVFTEELEDNRDTCDEDVVSIWRFDGAPDPQFIFRTEEGDNNIIGLEDDERVVLFPALAPADNVADAQYDPEIRALKSNIEYQIRDTELFNNAPARRHEFFWAGGPSFVTNSLQTGRVAIVNGAYRTNADGTQLANTFDVTFSQNNIIVHAQFDISPASITNFVELSAGTYQVNVFVNENQQTLFGSRAQDPDLAPTAQSIASSTITVAGNSRGFVVIQGGTADISAGAPTLSFLDATPSDDVVLGGQTEFQIVNLVRNQPLLFAAPGNDCCNFLNNKNAIQPGVSNSVILQSNNLQQTTFNAYLPNAQCTSLLSSLIQANALTLSNTVQGNSCRRQVIFIFGRVGTVQSPLQGTGAGCATCTAQRTFVRSLTALGSQGTASQITTQSANAPICQCAAAAAPVCDVCEAEEFDEVKATIAALAAQVSSSSVNTLSGLEELDGDVNGIEGQIDSVENLVGDVEKDINDVESKLDEQEDDLSSIRDAVSDVDDEVKKLRN